MNSTNIDKIHKLNESKGRGPQKDRLVDMFIDRIGLFLCVLAGRLLGKEDGLDVGKNSALRDGDTGQKLVKLLIVPDGELKVTRVDPSLLVVPGSIAGKLENLCSEVLHDGAEVDSSSDPHSLGVLPCAEKTVDSADGKLKTGEFGTGHGLGPQFATFASS